jgi:hypothetical protein
MDARRRLCLPPGPRVKAPGPSRAVVWVKRRFPTLASTLGRYEWTVILRSRRLVGHFRNGPGKRVGDLIDAGTDVLLICGRDEIQPFLQSGLDAVRGAKRKARLQIEVIPTLDHGLFPIRDREHVTDLVLGHVLAKFRPVPEGARTVPLSARTAAG